jgi:hypothetical protein
MALAEHLGLSQLTEAEWAALAKARGLPPRFKASPQYQPLAQVAPALHARPAFEDDLESADFAARFEELASRNASLFGR